MTLNLILISRIIFAVVLVIIFLLFVELFFGLPFQRVNVTVFFAFAIVALVLAIVRILLKIKTKTFKVHWTPGDF